VTCPSLQLPQNQGAARPVRRVDEPPNDCAARPTASPVSPTWFALRTTGAALAALALADGFNIQHPWWAAMSAWLVVQPTRRLLLERSLFRLAGTACGALAGAFTLHGLQDRPLLSIAAITLWLALCAGLGSNFRHFRNYGFVLAGYTAAIVVLFSLGDGTHDVGVAVDRVLCTIIGIVCSALASLCGVPAGGGGEDEILQRCLDRVEEYLREGRAQASADPLVAHIAALDRTVDEESAGSLSGRRDALRIRRVSGLLLELIALTSRRCVANHGFADQPILELSALARTSDELGVANALDDLLHVLRRATRVNFGDLVRDFDITSAVRAALRPIIAVALAAALWWSTALQTGT
jgi:uncharacterized membrane protein YccC